MSNKEIISNEVLSNKELVYTRDDTGSIQSAGYSINSEIMKSGMSIMETKNVSFNESSNSNTKQLGGKVSERFKDLAIPVGLLLMHQKPIQHYIQSNINKDEIIEDSLYNKLISLASENDLKKNIKRKNTKHNRKNKSNKKTKKTKK
jgi:hypothetical protein